MSFPCFQPPRAATASRGARTFLLLYALLGLTPVVLAQAPLSLEEAIAGAEREAPGLAARAAAERAAQLLVGPAGQLPDPQLVVGVDNLPVTGADAGRINDDFMTMRRVGVMQEFPRKAKRAARSERAQAEVEREQALQRVERLTVRESVARAWIAVALAERRVALLTALAPRLDAQVIAADAGLTAGRGSAADGIGARAQRVALAQRLTEAERDVIKARAELARWLPDDATRPLAAPPDFRTLDREPSAILADVDRHRGLLTFDADERIAQAELTLAATQKRPDWALEVSYGKREPAFSDMLSVGVRIDLPIFPGRRQDPVIAARRAAIDRLEGEREAARREHIAELNAAIAIWQSARARVDRYERELLPLAQDRADAALAAYRGGRGDLIAALTALNDLIEQQLALTDRFAELAEAWASLRYAFAQEH